MVKQKNQKKSDAEKNATTVNTSTTTTTTPATTTTATTVNAGANNTGGVSQTTTSGYSSSSSTNRNNTTTTVNTNNRTQYQQNQQKRDREKSTSSNQGNNYRKSNNSSENRGSRDYNKDRNNSHYLSTNGSYSKNKNRDNSSHSRKGGNSNYYSSNTNLANSNGVANQSQNLESKKADTRKQPNVEEAKKSAWSANTTITQEQGTEEERLENNKSEIPPPPVQQTFFSPTKKFKDTVLSYIECGEWDRVELICELVSLLDAFDLRLVYNCIEASQTTYSAQLKPMEKRANSMNPMFLFPAPDENFHQYFGDGRLVVETPSSSSSTSEACATSAHSVSSTLSIPKDAKSSACDATSEGEKKKTNPADEKQEQISFEKPSELAEALYILVALCESTNRKSAHLISLYVEAYCMTSRDYHLSKIADINDRIKVLETMGKVVSACLHHPAFSVSDKMKYAHARDQIRNEYDQMIIHAELASKCPGTVGGCKYVSERGVGDVDAEDEKATAQTDKYHVHHLNSASSTSPVQPVTFVYIQRFVGRYLEADDKFQIEIHWSDRDQTFTSRSREQLKVLQHRLLDEFGQQQRQDQSMTMSTNSDDENQLSTSTSSDAHNSNGRRILPRLNHDASPSEIVQYINELSDMPARMMLSRAICEEFNATRNKTNEDDNHSDGVSLSRWRPSPSVPSFARLTTPVSTTSNYAVSFVPMIYGSVPQNQLQVFQTTCSTCGGGHSYLFCPEMPILDRKKYLDEKGSQAKQTTPSVPPQQQQQHQQPQYAYTGPDGTHFSHHQNLFMQHQTRYIPQQVIHMYDPNVPGAYFNHPQPNLSYTNGNYN